MAAFVRKRRFKCRRLRRSADVADRQRRVPGFSQEVIEAARIAGVSAGGLGGEIAFGLALKGYGEVHVSDMDTVATTDLNRQRFTPEQIGDFKSVALCKNVSKQTYQGTVLVAHPYPVQALDLAAFRPDVVYCGVDLQVANTRYWVCHTLYRLGIPCVFAAVSRDASDGSVFIQEKGGPCWACAFKPEYQSTQAEGDASDTALRCPGTPAVIDILKTVAGISLHAIDSLLMPERPRDWNYRVISLTYPERDVARWVERRPDCPVCGSAKLNGVALSREQA